MSHIDLVDYLKRLVGESSQKEVAIQLGISPQYLNDILNYRRLVGQKVLDALNLKRITLYEARD